MPDPKIHSLNVKTGDCFLIERSSGRVTMIDICCGNLEINEPDKVTIPEPSAYKPSGNYDMRSKPTNPLNYLLINGISNIWRFILTHPDMDHMDGIKKLFNNKSILHFWDCGIRRKEKPDFEEGSYNEDDWSLYEDLIGGKIKSTTVISPRAGSKGKFWNTDNDEGTGAGDYISIIAPNNELIESANKSGDTNDASYVIVYRSSAGKIVFSGDSNDKTWEYVLNNHKDLVDNVAVLFAPHHGRKSDRDYSFLNTLRPRISFFGCAPSEHLAYSAWQSRDLLYFTNNQCGNINIYPVDDKIQVFIENKTYASCYTAGNTYEKNNHWFLYEV